MPQISELLHVSFATVKRRLRRYGLTIRQRYAQLVDERLDTLVSRVTSEFPNAGYRMVLSHLQVMGYRVPERRVRESLARVDPLSVAYRWAANRSIHRRQYHVPYPNAIWHMDANLSLSRWKYYVHCAIDGYSRLVTYLCCSTSNTARTTLRFFVKAGQQYGFPSRVRSDFGGENIDISQFMGLVRGANRGSHLTGRSVHNQRIERLWRDVFSECLSVYYHLFYYLENSGILDCDNSLHLFALQYVYTPRINSSLTAFQHAWNRHSLRTAASLSPIQLWVIGMLQNYNSLHLPVQEVFVPLSEMSTANLSAGEDKSGQSQETHLDQDILQTLQARVNPVQQSSTWGIDLYVTTLQILVDAVTS